MAVHSHCTPLYTWVYSEHTASTQQVLCIDKTDGRARLGRYVEILERLDCAQSVSVLVILRNERAGCGVCSRMESGVLSPGQNA